MQTSKRTMVKAIVWSLIGLLSMCLVGAVFTGSFTIGGKMAAANTVIGLFAYVLYERFWERVRWGRHE